MGLDSIWRKDGNTASVEGEFNLCGGIFSGFGNDSFRGKVYNRFVEDATGESLYQYEISNDTVKDMAWSLESHTWNPEFESRYDITEEEFIGLKKMFRLHADAGHTLHGWW